MFSTTLKTSFFIAFFALSTSGLAQLRKPGSGLKPGKHRSSQTKSNESEAYEAFSSIRHGKIVYLPGKDPGSKESQKNKMFCQLVAVSALGEADLALLKVSSRLGEMLKKLKTKRDGLIASERNLKSIGELTRQIQAIRSKIARARKGDEKFVGTSSYSLIEPSPNESTAFETSSHTCVAPNSGDGTPVNAKNGDFMIAEKTLLKIAEDLDDLFHSPRAEAELIDSNGVPFGFTEFDNLVRQPIYAAVDGIERASLRLVTKEKHDTNTKRLKELAKGLNSIKGNDMQSMVMKNKMIDGFIDQQSKAGKSFTYGELQGIYELLQEPEYEKMDGEDKIYSLNEVLHRATLNTSGYKD